MIFARMWFFEETETLTTNSQELGKYCTKITPSNIFMKAPAKHRSNIWLEKSDRHGVMDNAVACYTGGPGSIPAMSKCFFLSGIRW